MTDKGVNFDWSDARMVTEMAANRGDSDKSNHISSEEQSGWMTDEHSPFCGYVRKGMDCSHPFWPADYQERQLLRSLLGGGFTSTDSVQSQ